MPRTSWSIPNSSRDASSTGLALSGGRMWWAAPLVALTGNLFVNATVSPWQPSARQQRTASTQPNQTVSARVGEGREHASGGPARLLGFRRWRARSGGQYGRWRRAADRGDRTGKARVW